MDITFFARGLAIGFAIAAPVGLSVCSASGARWPMAAWSGSSPDWSGDGRRLLWRRRGARSNRGLVDDRRPTKPLAPRGRGLSLLPRRAHCPDAPGPGREARDGARVGRGLRVDVGADADQSDHDPLFRRGLRRAGTRHDGRRSRISRPHGRRRLRRVGALRWFLLSGTVGFFRRALTSARLRWVNRLSGALLVAIGVFSLLSWHDDCCEPWTASRHRAY